MMSMLPAGTGTENGVTSSSSGVKRCAVSEVSVRAILQRRATGVKRRMVSWKVAKVYCCGTELAIVYVIMGVEESVRTSFGMYSL